MKSKIQSLSLPFFCALTLSFCAPLFGFANPQEDIQRDYDALVDQPPVTRDFFTVLEREELFNQVANHPVASLASLSRYDHQPTGIGSKEVGFCYGRAMAVHLTARKMGLGNENIRKIFIAGDLSNGAGVRWRFHMATMVRGENGEWYMIDPIMPGMGTAGVSLPNDWMHTIKTRFDLRDGVDQSHFFVTNIQSIMVDMRVIPAQPSLEIQDRLIEPSFNPEGREGFNLVELNSRERNRYPVYEVSGTAQEKYFVLRDEPLVNGTPLDHFDFFTFATVILYQNPGDLHPSFVPRAYHYNGYFVDLIKSFQE